MTFVGSNTLGVKTDKGSAQNSKTKEHGGGVDRCETRSRGRPLDYWFANNFMYDIQIICHAQSGTSIGLLVYKQFHV